MQAAAKKVTRSAVEKAMKAKWRNATLVEDKRSLPPEEKSRRRKRIKEVQAELNTLFEIPHSKTREALRAVVNAAHLAEENDSGDIRLLTSAVNDAESLLRQLDRRAELFKEKKELDVGLHLSRFSVREQGRLGVMPVSYTRASGDTLEELLEDIKRK